jgi:hypothetical protein
VQTDDKPKTLFFRVGTSVMDEGALRQMSGVDLKVYAVLSRHADWYTGKCWPSYKTIRSLSGCSFESISSAVRRLVRLGTISVRKEKARNGLRNVYTVFRTLQPSSGIHSRTTEYPLAKKKRDNLGRFQSSRAEDPCSRTTEYPHSSRTDQNEINLNEINGIRLKEFPPRPQRGSGQASETSARPVLTISEGILRKYLKIKTKAQVRDMLRQGNRPIPEFLLGEEENVSPEGQAKAEALKPEGPGKGGI